jgi:hypothetical protein
MACTWTTLTLFPTKVFRPEKNFVYTIKDSSGLHCFSGALVENLTLHTFVTTSQGIPQHLIEHNMPDMKMTSHCKINLSRAVSVIYGRRLFTSHIEYGASLLNLFVSIIANTRSLISQANSGHFQLKVHSDINKIAHK